MLLLVLMCQWFAPTTLVISFETEGPGRFTEDEIDHIIERDEKGRVVALQLPQKMVLVANHQVCFSPSVAKWTHHWQRN